MNKVAASLKSPSSNANPKQEEPFRSIEPLPCSAFRLNSHHSSNSSGKAGVQLPKSIFWSAGSLGTPQNMMLVSMVHRSSEKQQDTLWARVKELRGERLKMEYQICPSRKPFEVFMKNRLLQRSKEGVRLDHE